MGPKPEAVALCGWRAASLSKKVPAWNYTNKGRIQKGSIRGGQLCHGAKHKNNFRRARQKFKKMGRNGTKERKIEHTARYWKQTKWTKRKGVMKKILTRTGGQRTRNG
jgi:hypothetical protein